MTFAIDYDTFMLLCVSSKSMCCYSREQLSNEYAKIFLFLINVDQKK